jgi:hypothetical protein
MNRSFSLATLNLFVAIAAVALASTRTALARAWSGDAREAVLVMIAGGAAGFFVALAMAIWNRPGWLVSLATVAGGFFLGTAAGAQMTVQVDWPVIFAGPYLVIAAVLLIVANRRRRARAQTEIFERTAV